MWVYAYEIESYTSIMRYLFVMIFSLKLQECKLFHVLYIIFDVIILCRKLGIVEIWLLLYDGSDAEWNVQVVTYIDPWLGKDLATMKCRVAVDTADWED
jgi:hypothetical protein